MLEKKGIDRRLLYVSSGKARATWIVRIRSSTETGVGSTAEVQVIRIHFVIIYHFDELYSPTKSA
jgi:hypothetical protein